MYMKHYQHSQIKKLNYNRWIIDTLHEYKVCSTCKYGVHSLNMCSVIYYDSSCTCCFLKLICFLYETSRSVHINLLSLHFRAMEDLDTTAKSLESQPNWPITLKHVIRYRKHAFVTEAISIKSYTLHDKKLSFTLVNHMYYAFLYILTLDEKGWLIILKVSIFLILKCYCHITIYFFYSKSQENN